MGGSSPRSSPMSINALCHDATSTINAHDVQTAAEALQSLALADSSQNATPYSEPAAGDNMNAPARSLAKSPVLDQETRRRRESRQSTHAPYQPHHRRHPNAERSHQPALTGVSASTWQRLVVHAGSAAGATAAVISEESMKCLRYCLSWLQYAMYHIEQQMDILRSFLVSLATSPSKAVVTSDGSSILTTVKNEIIQTLRKVVEVVSKHAGSALPEHAKAAIRGFILDLPQRWANCNKSRPSFLTPQSNEPTLATRQVDHETSIQLLNFSGESIEMLQAVANVFSDSINRAELWIERLGIQKDTLPVAEKNK